MDEKLKRQIEIIQNEVLVEIAVRDTRSLVLYLHELINSQRIRLFGKDSYIMNYLVDKYNIYRESLKIESGIIPDKIENQAPLPQKIEKSNENITWRQKCLELKYRESTGENFMKINFSQGDLHKRICAELNKEFNNSNRATVTTAWNDLSKYTPGSPDVLTIRDIKDLHKALPGLIKDLKIVAGTIINSKSTVSLINSDIEMLEKLL